MSTASMAARRGPPVGKSAGSKNWIMWTLGGIVGLAILAFLIAWAGGWIRLTTDPRVLEIRQMQKDAMQKFQANGGPSNVAEVTEAMETMVKIRQKVEELPEHLRPEVRQESGSMMRNAMQARVNKYFELPPADRDKELDKQIDQEEMFRKAFETGQGVMAMFGGRQGGGGQGGGPGGGGAGGPGGGQGGNVTVQGNVAVVQGGPGRATEEDRNRWRKSMIDQSSAEDRAKFVEYRRAMDERRKARGLPTTPWGGR